MKLSLDGVSKYFVGEAGFEMMGQWSFFALYSRKKKVLVKALKSVSIVFEGPGVLGVLGENGSGKTTLLRVIAGILPPDEGRVVLDGEPLRARDTIFIPATYLLAETMTVKENIELLCELKDIDYNKAVGVLRRLGLEYILDRNPRTLSSGESASILLALILSSDAKVKLLDEPFSRLDPGRLARAKELVKEAGEESIVVLSTNRPRDLEGLADRVLILSSGRAVFYGTLKEFSDKYSPPGAFLIKVLEVKPEVLDELGTKYKVTYTPSPINPSSGSIMFFGSSRELASALKLLSGGAKLASVKPVPSSLNLAYMYFRVVSGGKG